MYGENLHMCSMIVYRHKESSLSRVLQYLNQKL